MKRSDSLTAGLMKSPVNELQSAELEQKSTLIGQLKRAGLSSQDIAALSREWLFKARHAQLPPVSLPDQVDSLNPDFSSQHHWRSWLIMGGRGSGKTRAGAEWVNGMALGLLPFTTQSSGNIALVGETLSDVREVMVEGPSGILSISRLSRPKLETTRRRLVWENGAVASFYSSEDPDSLRGPQFSAAWCDELAKWKYPQQTWDMLQFGLRLGHAPRQVVTTTPRPLPLLRALINDVSTAVTKMRTDENSNYLAPAFLVAMQEKYVGTALGRQELDGEMIEERADALWSRAQLEHLIDSEVPDLERIVIAVDPPATSTKNSDACGIVAAGIDAHGMGWILEDASLPAAKPHQWAAQVVNLYHRLQADLIVAEVNQGGDMVTAVIHAHDANVPVRAVRAHRGKWLRAEPVAALYEQHRVRHAARFHVLEDEMCDFAASGLSSGRSPDRLDALVWALSILMLQEQHKPRIRHLR